MKTPERIVSLISSATEILFLLEMGDKVVGISHECDYPPAALERPRLTRSLVDSAVASRQIDDQVRRLTEGQSALYAIDVERLAELAPELIITQAQCDVCAVRYADVISAVRATPALRHTRVLALNPLSLGDVLNDIARVGEAAGALSQAAAARQRLEARVEAIRARTAKLTLDEIPRVVCLEWIDPPMVAANWTPELVAAAGGEPGLARGGVHSTYADWRQIVDYDPEVLVVMPCGFDLARTAAEAAVLPGWEGWSELAAVRAGRVYLTDGNAYFNRSGPRLVDSMEILAHLFHPQSFAPPPAANAWSQWGADGRQAREEAR